MDDLGKRLRKVGAIRWGRLVGAFVVVLGILIILIVSGTAQSPAPPLPWFAWAACSMPIVFGVAYWSSAGTPRARWGPTAWVAEHGVLCESHPTPLRLRRYSSPSARASLLIDGRLPDEQATRIVVACDGWAAHLESDPSAYAAFWKRWREDDPAACSLELVFGPEAAGGFLVHTHREYRWFLLVPHHRKSPPGNRWHHAHRIPVHWTDQHADSIPFDWSSDDS